MSQSVKLSQIDLHLNNLISVYKISRSIFQIRCSLGRGVRGWRVLGGAGFWAVEGVGGGMFESKLISSPAVAYLF